MLLILYVHFSPLYRSVSFSPSNRMIKTQWIECRALNTNDDVDANVVRCSYGAHSVTIPINSKGRLYEWKWTKRWKIKYGELFIYVWWYGYLTQFLHPNKWMRMVFESWKDAKANTFWCVDTNIWRKPKSLHFECIMLLLLDDGAIAWMLLRRIGKLNCSNSHLFVVGSLFNVASNVDGMFPFFVFVGGACSLNIVESDPICLNVEFYVTKIGLAFHCNDEMNIIKSFDLSFCSICAWFAYGERKKPICFGEFHIHYEFIRNI